VYKLLKKLYEKSPSFLQSVGVNLYGLGVYRREYGRQFEKILSEFEQMQWLSASELEAYQDEKLRALIKHCFDNVPFYRKAMDARRLTPSDIVSSKDLPKLPIVTKAIIRDSREELFARNFKRSQLLWGNTSGTTGMTLDLFYDSFMGKIKNVVDWRHKRWAGVNPRDRIAIMSGRTIVPPQRAKPPYWRMNWILNHLYFSSWHLSPENMELYAVRMEKFNPVAFEGYPSSIYIFAKYLLSRNSRLPLKAVFTTSEPLLPQQRETIEKAFECAVFDFYGMAERVIFAGECERHNGMHINEDFGITELIGPDGDSISVGEIGRIVGTSLYNYGMPLIRYQTSDITGLKNTKCPCGRNFRLMDGIATKDEDIIITEDGRLLPPSMLHYPFYPMDRVSEVQFIQEDTKNLRIKLVRLPTFQAQDAERILREIQARVGGGMNLQIEFVEQIPRSRSGKLRCVISKVPLPF